MPLRTFDTWNALVTCVDTPDDCVGTTTVRQGRAPLVSDTGGNFDKELTGVEYPGIPYAVSDSVTELRSGSSSQPLRFPKMMKQRGGSIPSLMSRKNDGTIFSWTPMKVCYPRKLSVLPNGGIVDVPDLNSRIFDVSCVGNLADASHVGMAKSFTDCD